MQIVIAVLFVVAGIVAYDEPGSVADLQNGILIVLITKILINVLGSGLPVIMILQYPSIRDRLGGWILSCNRHSAVVYALEGQNENNKIKIDEDQYMIELRQMWYPSKQL